MDSTSTLVLVVDEKSEILLANRQARRMLGSPAVGALLSDVLQGDAQSSVLEAIRDAITRGRRVRFPGVPVDDGFVHLDLGIEPFAGHPGTALILGHASEETPPAWRARRAAAPADDETDLVATNEELQAANEELAATNEELQAANEELAALNEEFQTSNESLGIANEGLETEAGERHAALALLRSIIQSSEDALVVVDASRRIVLWNAAALGALGLGRLSLGVGLDAAGLPLRPQDLQDVVTRAALSPEPIVATLAGTSPERRMLEVRARCLRAPQGVILGWLLSWRRRG